MTIRFLIIVFCAFATFRSFAQDSAVVFDPSIENFRIDEAGLDSGDVFTFWGLYFNLGSYDLMDTSFYKYLNDQIYAFLRSNEVRLMTIADYLFRHPGYIVEIGVHTDCRGSKHSCRRLSQRRAQTICDELVALGVEAGRLVPKGFEESQPYVLDGKRLTCDYILKFPKLERDELHQKNRRFQIRVLSKEYVPLKESP